MLKQVVLIKMDPENDERNLQQLSGMLQALKQHIPGLLSTSCGKNRRYTNNLPQQCTYSHIFMMDFVDEDFYELFQEHPETKVFHENLKSLCLPGDSMMVIEYPLELILSP